mmetsp:Transcript_61594/g.123503  ORF Transcript_61594/g.123503 Transcript_61594/m.123503 type:complete len:239 (+) Transcript_61594:604-1320(+)
MFKIFPLRGRIACVLRSLPCLAEPAALSPSTMKISASDASRVAQSESLPGSTVEVSNVLRRTMSLAARAAADAAAADCAFSTIAASTLGFHSKACVRASPTTWSTTLRTPGLPSRFFVWPSNSASESFTVTTAVKPSRTNSPAKLSSPEAAVVAALVLEPALAFDFPAVPFFPPPFPSVATPLDFSKATLFMALFTERVRMDLKASTWVPPSLVLIPLANETKLSLYMSELHANAMST